MRTIIILFLLFSTQIQSQSLRTGIWRAELFLNDSTTLPFNFEVKANKLFIINDSERLESGSIRHEKDSVFIDLELFDSEIRVKKDENILTGSFINHSRVSNTTIKFRAEYGIASRFSDRPEKNTHDISGRWKIIWESEEGVNKTAIGIFKQDENKLSGTFLTPTGDYRFLDGEVSGSDVWLSAFDGSHAFLFYAKIQSDGTLKGDFYSGSHWHDAWLGWKDEKIELPDAESLTYLKPGFNKVSFSFPDENGNLISLPNENYKNKVLIIQVMGSWCPNCMDESIYLSELHRQYNSFGLEILALDFERLNDSARAFKVIKKMRDRLNIPYPVLFAGSSAKTESSKALPMLNKILAYPTMIIIDKKGKVKKIHTGFNGPATGELYSEFRKNYDSYIRSLLAE